MNAQQQNVARECVHASHEGLKSFPEIVGALIAAGFESYAVDLRSHTATYFLPDGDCLALETPATEGQVAAAFDAPGVASQVAWAQANPPDYSYGAFCRNVKRAGCAGYIVSFLGRRVVYYGRTAETHVEHFPG